jgi:hypothetical protein
MLTATHSLTSTYFGSMTIVLKLPLTRADSTKGLHKYKGLAGVSPVGEGGIGGGGISGGKDVDVGVGERFGPRGARLMERPIELKKDISELKLTSPRPTNK